MEKTALRTHIQIVLAVLVTSSVMLLIAPGTANATVAFAGVSTQPLAFGDAQTYGQVALATGYNFVGMARTPDDKGYWLVGADGGVFTFGDAGFYGSLGATPLNAPIVGIAATPDGKGYWLVAADGGVFTFGDASFYGSMGVTPLNGPVVGMAATADGRGYWLVADDGGVFTFGDAAFLGAALDKSESTIVGIAAIPNGTGYWLVNSQGDVFDFGTAGSDGSLGNTRLNAAIVGIAATTDGNGYWLVGADGGVFAFGDAQYLGSDGDQQLFSPVVSITPTSDGDGYWLLTSTPIPPPGVPLLGHPTDFYNVTAGFGLVKPPIIFLGGDPTGLVVDIHWDSWGGVEAVGTGTSDYVAPTQTVSEGTDEAVTVVAFNLGSCGGQLMYESVEWYFPQHGEYFVQSDVGTLC
jgi:hypothetical protein